MTPSIVPPPDTSPSSITDARRVETVTGPTCNEFTWTTRVSRLPAAEPSAAFATTGAASASAVFADTAVCVDPVSSRNRNGPRPFNRTASTISLCPGSNDMTSGRSLTAAGGADANATNPIVRNPVGRMNPPVRRRLQCARPACAMS